MNYFQYLYELFYGNYKKMKLFTPDPKLVAEEVSKRPFEPFGIGGVVPDRYKVNNLNQASFGKISARKYPAEDEGLVQDSKADKS
jgi:hypothetical protein